MASPTRSSLLSLLLEQSLEEEETVMWTLFITLLSRSEEAATHSCVFLLLFVKLNYSLRFRSKQEMHTKYDGGCNNYDFQYLFRHQILWIRFCGEDIPS